jgi:hypothetical protein
MAPQFHYRVFVLNGSNMLQGSWVNAVAWMSMS